MEPSRRDPYAMNVDRGRNCYTYGGFGHLARNCKIRGTRGKIEEGRRLEYENGNIEERRRIKGGSEDNNNLNREQGLIILN